MTAMYSLVFVFLLVLIPLIGVGSAHLEFFFAVCVPTTAIIIFLAGFVYKIFQWTRSPVPFRIPTTGGQQQSLDWIKQNKWDNPSTGAQTFIRMLLEVFTFRSLFRNTKVDLNKETGVLGYSSSKWLWMFAILFHYGFFIVAVRHMRLFTEPVPIIFEWLEFGDGILQLGVPRLYLSDLLLVTGISLLLIRRLWDSRVRYISLFTDYFPLLLILGVALSGIYMRYFAKVDVVAIKAVTMGMVTFSYANLPFEQIGASFYVHVFLVSSLLAYFPFSKLMHLGGVFLSPTRNMPNDTRIKHHENPWNPDIKPHSYEAYEKDFGPAMHEAGLPVVDPANRGEQA